MNRILDEPTSIAKIKAKIDEIAKLRKLPRDCPEFKKWYREILALTPIKSTTSTPFNSGIAADIMSGDQTP